MHGLVFVDLHPFIPCGLPEAGPKQVSRMLAELAFPTKKEGKGVQE